MTLRQIFIIEQIGIGVLVVFVALGLGCVFAYCLIGGVGAIEGDRAAQFVVAMFTLESIFFTAVFLTVQIRLQGRHNLWAFFPETVILLFAFGFAMVEVREGLTLLSRLDPTTLYPMGTLYWFVFEMVVFIASVIGLSGVGILVRQFVDRFGFLEPDLIRQDANLRRIQAAHRTEEKM